MNKSREPTDTERFLQSRQCNRLTDKEKEYITYLQSGHRVILSNNIELSAKRQKGLTRLAQYLTLNLLHYKKLLNRPTRKLCSPRGKDLS